MVMACRRRRGCSVDAALPRFGIFHQSVERQSIVGEIVSHRAWLPEPTERPSTTRTFGKRHFRDHGTVGETNWLHRENWDARPLSGCGIIGRQYASRTLITDQAFSPLSLSFLFLASSLPAGSLLLPAGCRKPGSRCPSRVMSGYRSMCIAEASGKRVRLFARVCVCVFLSECCRQLLLMPESKWLVSFVRMAR